MEEGWHNQDEEELPRNLFESDWTGDENDDICQVESHHTESCALTADVCWEDFGPAMIVNTNNISTSDLIRTHRGIGKHRQTCSRKA